MTAATKIAVTSYGLAARGLVGVLLLGLLPALVAGFFIHQLVEFGAAKLGRVGILPHIGRVILLIVIAVIVISAISFGVAGLVSRMTAGPESLVVLLHKMADVVDTARGHMPLWMRDYMPSTMDEWQAAASAWLRDNASHVSGVGHDVGLFLVRVIIGMIIGGLIALGAGGSRKMKPLAFALNERMNYLVGAFRRIVFSQIRISTLNTVLTGIFLFGVMPLIGNDLPLTKTLMVVTFIIGLLPIVGNLVSNTAIVLVALSVSPMAAVVSLVFLVLIHKLEYFANAHIIGGQIHSHAWELLVAMLVMEAAFGISGVIAAPIYYAYVKDELSANDLV
jgi:predicted PurR-regulated permease PerM